MPARRVRTDGQACVESDIQIGGSRGADSDMCREGQTNDTCRAGQPDRLFRGKPGHPGRGPLSRPLGGADEPGRASCSQLPRGEF